MKSTFYTQRSVLALRKFICVCSVLLFGLVSHAQVVDFRLYFINETQTTRSLSLNDIVITDEYISQGVHHVYAKRQINEIEVYNSYAAYHNSGRVEHLSDAKLFPYLNESHIVNSVKIRPQAAIRTLIDKKGWSTDGDILPLSNARNQARSTYLLNDIAYGIIAVEQKLWVGEKASIYQVYSIEIEEKPTGEWNNYFINAETGVIIDKVSWSVECQHNNKENHNHNTKKCSSENHTTRSSMVTDSSYNILPYPIENPNYGSRSIISKPWLSNTTASPIGWHKIGTTDYQVTKGNNVDVYLDVDGNNSPTNGDADRADGGANLSFDFAWDAITPVTQLPDPALTNLFYWNNVIHDVWYNYGFDEASGNFQSENFGGSSGLADDYVQAEAQDGGGFCNARMGTPPDGQSPRMQMYLCNNRDGDFDNGVIVHEYGHGVSNRLTGGPSAAGCLGNQEQMGEGWSDWMALMMTIEDGDTGTDARPIGTWLVNQTATGNGIRTYKYSTDMAVNPLTYGDIGSQSVPHGVGAVWATMLWDLNWALVDELGAGDLYNGTGGNNITMTLVIEAMKLQPCGPGFVDGRDAILLVDEMMYGGAHQCTIWEVFANRGLGYSASQGSANNVDDGVEAFDVHPSCGLEVVKTVDKVDALPGETIKYTLTATNNSSIAQTSITLKDKLPEGTTFMSASDGGVLVSDTVVWNMPDMSASASLVRTLTVQLDVTIDPVEDDYFDDMESGSADWLLAGSGSTSWMLQDSVVQHGMNAWFAPDVSSYGGASLQLIHAIGVQTGTTVHFSHRYDTEEAWDGGTVEGSLDNGKTWIDLGAHFTSNGYNNLIFNSKPGFSGNSGGFVTSTIDLSAFDGRLIIIKFEMNCDAAVGGNGWFIDDIFVEGRAKYIPNTALLNSDQHTSIGVLQSPTKLTIPPTELMISVASTDISCFDAGDGMASVTAMGGSGAYTYLWSNGQNTSSITITESGNYHVDVSDGNRVRRAYFCIQEPTEIVPNETITNAIGFTNGSAVVSPIGGAEGYTYLWSTGSTTDTATDLPPGNYTVNIMDQEGCDTTLSIVIADLAAGCIQEVFTLEFQLDQFVQENEYELLDENEMVIASFDFEESDPGRNYLEVFCLADGCYTLRLIDDFGDGVCNNNSSPMGYVKFTEVSTGNLMLDKCVFQIFDFEFCVGTSVGPFDANLEVTPATCYGDTDGSIRAVASGGSQIYTYDWSTGDTQNQLSNLSTGHYTVTVSDGINSKVLYHHMEYDNSMVTNSNNSGPGSLRAVLNNGCEVDTVLFEGILVGDTIFLEDEIVIDTKSKYIYGNGIYGTYISGQGVHRIFHVTDTGVLSLRTMTLIDGYNLLTGGAIYNQGSMLLHDTKFISNHQDQTNEAITNEGSVELKGKVDIRD